MDEQALARAIGRLEAQAEENAAFRSRVDRQLNDIKGEVAKMNQALKDVEKLEIKAQSVEVRVNDLETLRDEQRGKRTVYAMIGGAVGTIATLGATMATRWMGSH
jgi:DNA repair exonuclease SbcCD ATPase subunit